MRLFNAINAAPFVALFVFLTSIPAIPLGTPKGLAVRIARTQPCGADDRRFVVVRVLSSGALKINMEDVTRDNLGRRLEELLKTRVDRWVFVEGDPDLPFGAIADVIDAVSEEVDYISVLTPSILKQARAKAGICIDPNLPRLHRRSLR